MALPPKKKYKTRPNKTLQAQQERESLRKMMTITGVFLLVPLIVVGVKQVNPGIFYLVLGRVEEKLFMPDAAAKAYEAGHTADPKNLDSLVDAMRIHEHKQRYDAVSDLAGDILDSTDPPPSPSQVAAANYFLAQVAVEAGDFDGALEKARSAQPELKGDFLYRDWIILGRCQTNSKNWQDAYTAFDTACSLRRLFASEAHYWEGKMYEAQGQKDNALEQYNYGLDQQPDARIKQMLLEAKTNLAAGPS